CRHCPSSRLVPLRSDRPEAGPVEIPTRCGPGRARPRTAPGCFGMHMEIGLLHMMRPSVWKPPPGRTTTLTVVPPAEVVVAAAAGLADRPTRAATPAAAAMARAAIRVRMLCSLSYRGCSYDQIRRPRLPIG